MDRLDELAIFVRIVEEGSLARAAARLRRSPPAVTRALASLEDRIGVRLIDRTTRRLAPSEAGRALYDKARTLVADYEAATAGAPDAPVRGLLRITAPVQFGRRHIAPIVARFLDAHAGVEVELLLGDRNIDLIDEGVDVALRIGPLADSGLTARLVGQVRRLWVASPAYLKRRGTPRTPGRPGASRGAARHAARQHRVAVRRRPSRRAAPADRTAAGRRCRDPAARGARGPRHRPAPVLPGGRRAGGRQAGAPAAGLRAAAAARASRHQGPRPPRAQDRCLPRLRGPASRGLAGAVRSRRRTA